MQGGAGLSRDRFLGGRLVIAQPRSGYRAGTDSVLLAAAVPAVRGQTVLELGCGAGVASLCLDARVPGLSLHGVERQPDYADLARENAALNGVTLAVTCADVASLPAAMLKRTFDHVIANPPYFDTGSGTAARDPGREVALRETTPLADWIDAGLRRLRVGGWLTLIQRADRLPDILAELDRRTGHISVLPLTGRAGQPAGRIIVQAEKGARGPFRLLAPIVLHEGPCHSRDGDDYTAAARAVLRDGLELPIRLAPSRRIGEEHG